jgi:hypothetical protein
MWHVLHREKWGARNIFIHFSREHNNTYHQINKRSCKNAFSCFQLRESIQCCCIKKEHKNVFFKKQTKNKQNKNIIYICPFLFHVVYQATSHRIASATRNFFATIWQLFSCDAFSVVYSSWLNWSTFCTIKRKKVR